MATPHWTRRENVESPVTVKRRGRKPKTPPTPVVLNQRGEFPCHYCGRVFSTEKIVLSHLCEQRRRFQQKDTQFARFGFEAFNEINAHIFGRDAVKTEEEFRKSEFYLACLRWGHFVIDINCMDVREYLKWLLKLNIPIDKWDNDQIYDCWLQALVFEEDPWVSYERCIKSLARWSEETDSNYIHYFREAGTARIMTDIRNGSVTGWLVFCSDSGKEWMGSISSSDLEIVWGWLDAARWKFRFEKLPEEFNQFNEMNTAIGI